MGEDKVIILGKEIDRENFPKLYAWGKSNPVWLEKNIRSMLKKEGWGEEKAGSMMAILESDLK